MSNLLRWRLAGPHPGEPAWRAHSPWQADEAVIRSLREQRWTDPAAARWSTLVVSMENAPLLYPNLLAQLLTHLRYAPYPVEIAVTGREGSGRQTLGAQLSASPQPSSSSHSHLCPSQ